MLSPEKENLSDAGLKRLMQMHTMSVPGKTQYDIDKMVRAQLKDENLEAQINYTEEIKEEQVETSMSGAEEGKENP